MEAYTCEKYTYFCANCFPLIRPGDTVLNLKYAFCSDCGKGNFAVIPNTEYFKRFDEFFSQKLLMEHSLC